MDDLQVLNKRILSHSGTPNDNIEKVLELISVCLGKLKPSGQALSDFIGLIAQQTNENPLDVVSINKEFLQFARQTARDVTSGYFDGLIVLNIDFAQAWFSNRLAQLLFRFNTCTNLRHLITRSPFLQLRLEVTYGTGRTNT